MCRWQNCGQAHIDTLTSQKLREISQVKKQIELLTVQIPLFKCFLTFQNCILNWWKLPMFYIYIYIYRERERERERDTHTHTHTHTLTQRKIFLWLFHHSLRAYLTQNTHSVWQQSLDPDRSFSDHCWLFWRKKHKLQNVNVQQYFEHEPENTFFCEVSKRVESNLKVFQIFNVPSKQENKINNQHNLFPENSWLFTNNIQKLPIPSN